MCTMEFFRTKSIRDVREAAGQSSLRKNLGVLDLTFLGLGGIIGTGIFVLTGLAAALYAGPAITVSFFLGGLACVFTALAYAELASMLPVAGGAYSYAAVTLGEGLSSVVGWAVTLMLIFGGATVASGWSGYVVGILEAMGIHIPFVLTHIPSEGGWVNLPALLIVLALTTFLVRGMQSAARLNGILVIVKLCAIFLFVVCAVPHAHFENWSVFAPNGFTGIAKGAGFVFMAYTGFDTLANAAEECRNPNRDLPLGIIISLVGSALLYILVSGLLTALVPYAELNNSEPMAYALRQNGVGIGAALVGTGAMAGMTTVILTQLFGLSRMFMVMSRDGMMPKFFSRIHPKYSTPYYGVIISGLVMFLIAGFAPVASLGQLSSMATLAVFAFVSLCVMILRYRAPQEPRTFRCPAVFLVASTSLVMCTFFFAQLLVENWWPYLLSTAVGLAIYIFYGGPNSAALRARRDPQAALRVLPPA